MNRRVAGGLGGCRSILPLVDPDGTKSTVPRLYVPQDYVDRPDIAGEVVLDPQGIVLNHGGKRYRLSPGVLFLKVVAGEDVEALIGRVKSAEALQAMGAEHYETSVVWGDTAYEVQPGFLGEAF